MARTRKPPSARQRRQAEARKGDRPTVLVLSVAAAALAAGAALVGIFARRREWLIGDAEHTAPDLALDRPRPGPDDRAPQAFRPDPTAPVPASEREGLRPATGPAPTMVDG